MIKVDVYKVYTKDDLVAIIKRAGELVDACKLSGCGLDDCAGCPECDALFAEVSLLELSFYLPEVANWSGQFLYNQAEELDALSEEEFEELSRRARSMMRVYLFNLQREARSISYPRSRRELETWWVDQPVSRWEEVV